MTRSRPISQIVIPARLASTRLPRKLLLRETGKSLLQHTYESASRARWPRGITVAVDHEELAAEVVRFGGQFAMTDPAAASGTDRVAEVAAGMPDVELFVNVQGDEPEIAGASIDLAIELLHNHPEAEMATLATPIRTRQRLLDPACVKVVFDHRQRALYFSRSPIPCPREWDDRWLAPDAAFFQHVGLYAYRREALVRLAQTARCRVEQVESLEQLRALYLGMTLLVGIVDEPSKGVDTPEDYRAFVSRAANC